MAKHFSLLLVVCALALAGGCQEQPNVEQLPCANFNGPLVEAPPTPPVVVPQKYPPVVNPNVGKPPVAASFNTPREWIPGVRANSWSWIVIHHSATTTGGARSFDRMHREKGWDELGYHFVIGNGTDTGDGQVEVGSRWPKQKWGAHAKTPDNRFNEHGIGICLVGNFDKQRPTRAQMQSLARLVAHLQKTYGVTTNCVIGHRDTKSTDCPGHNMNVADVRRMASQLAGIGQSEPLAQTARGELLFDVKR